MFTLILPAKPTQLVFNVTKAINGHMPTSSIANVTTRMMYGLDNIYHIDTYDNVKTIKCRTAISCQSMALHYKYNHNIVSHNNSIIIKARDYSDEGIFFYIQHFTENLKALKHIDFYIEIEGIPYKLPAITVPYGMDVERHLYPDTNLYLNTVSRLTSEICYNIKRMERVRIIDNILVRI